MDLPQNQISTAFAGLDLAEASPQQQSVPEMKTEPFNTFEILQHQQYAQNKMFDRNILSFQLSHLMPWFDRQLRDKYMMRGRRANIQNEDNDIEKKLNSISIPWNMRLHSPMLRG